MIVKQFVFDEATDWTPALTADADFNPQFVTLFGSCSILRSGTQLCTLREQFPAAAFFGCSTAGEIIDTRVLDESLVATAIQLESGTVKAGYVALAEADDSFLAGERLGQQIDRAGLVHIMVLSDGLHVNGSELVRGLSSVLPNHVTITGGLAGDGERFRETCVLCGTTVADKIIAVAGFYGDRIKIGHGCLGGWDPFGPERLITRSEGNILYELDGKSALELYKEYLGEHAAGLPATGLLFPLSLRSETQGTGVVRTILAIDEKKHSMTFAGDVPEGHYARLMKANFNRLIDGAANAASTSIETIGSQSPDLSILISCVGRRMVLKQRIEEEVEAVREVLGRSTAITGFYSYGEISPFTPRARCELHNQTMTITTISER